MGTLYVSPKILQLKETTEIFISGSVPLADQKVPLKSGTPEFKMFPTTQVKVLNNPELVSGNSTDFAQS